jgi:hypothetical protein
MTKDTTIFLLCIVIAIPRKAGEAIPTVLVRRNLEKPSFFSQNYQTGNNRTIEQQYFCIFAG